MLSRSRNRFLSLLAVFLIRPISLRACACGCGLFDVQESAVAPNYDAVYPVQRGAPETGVGYFGYVEYDNANQNQNWSGSRPASNDNNADKLLHTDFFTAGVQDMVNERWGWMAEVPAWNRAFKTADDSGNVSSLHDASIGDMRLRGVYAGFSSDMRTGLTFGAKLPTGDFKAAGFDRDSQIGTGSTDLLLGVYHFGALAARWAWFGNLLFDQPVLTAGGYRPGAELDALLGASFWGWSFSGLRFSPLAQAIVSRRGRDSGLLAHFGDTGYTRLLAGPGFELAAGRLRADASVGFPLAQNVNGNQLMAAQYWKVSVGVRF